MSTAVTPWPYSWPRPLYAEIREQTEVRALLTYLHHSPSTASEHLNNVRVYARLTELAEEGLAEAIAGARPEKSWQTIAFAVGRKWAAGVYKKYSGRIA